MNARTKTGPGLTELEPRWGARGTARATIAAGLMFENINHAYDGNPSVSELSLDVSPGEVLCLLGHSGCGKTTLMRIAAGVEQPLSGRVLINGREVSGPSVFVPPEKRGVGLMFQDYALFPHMTILENVVFGLREMDKAAGEREALALLERVGLNGYAEDYPHALSGGEQQRVALARAIAPRPSVLLMDEPFSGLDRRLRDNVRDETMTILRETRATCIMVTHDPEEAMRMGDKIALMRRGRLVQHGTSQELYSKPADVFAAKFFSELNELEGTVTAAGIETPIGTLPGGDWPVGSKLSVCIRPHGLLPEASTGRQAVGRISSKRFVGDMDLLTIVVEGLYLPLHARLRPGSGLEEGMDVSLGTDPQDVLIFDAETAH